MQVFHYTRKLYDDAVRVHGISAPQLAALHRVAEEPGLTGTELANKLFTTPQAAQLMLGTLERKGLVERKSEQAHGRIVRSILTEEGRRIVRLGLGEVRKVDEWLVDGLDADKRDALIELLAQFMERVAVRTRPGRS